MRFKSISSKSFQTYTESDSNPARYPIWHRSV